MPTLQDPLGYGALLGLALVAAAVVVVAVRRLLLRATGSADVGPVMAGRGARGSRAVAVPLELPECTALLCADRGLESGFFAAVAGRSDGVLWLSDDLGPASAPTVEALLRKAARGDQDRLAAWVAGLQLEPLLERSLESLDAVQRLRVQLASSLLSERVELLVVEASAGLAARERADLLACLRWLRTARGLQVVYGIRSTADLEDLADALVVVDERGHTYGPGEPWVLLGATWRGPLVDRLDVVSTLSARVDYLDEEGRWLRVLACGDREVYLPFQRLSPGWRGRIAVRPESVLLVTDPLPGPRLTNQIRGRVAEVGDLLGRHLVSVDVGGGAERLRALVEPDTVRERGFGPGTEVVCVFEPGAVRWVGAVP